MMEMKYTKLKCINQYKNKSINPAKTPDTVFEMYSVPIYETGHPEYLRGNEIASNKVIVEKNDILLCKINPRINRVWVVADESDKQNIASSEWIVIRNSEYNAEFLAWYFRSFRFQKLMTSEVTGIGGSLTRAQPKCVAEYPVPVLDRKKQNEIVEILNKCKFIIDSRKRELVELDNLIKARFVEMFGDPVYNTNDLPIRNLNELGSWASGGTPSRTVPEYFEGNIDWYSAGELNTLFLEGSVEKITEEAIEKSATKLFKAGSLLIGMYDTAAFKMGILKEDSASNQACACITPNDEVNIIWLYYELQMMKEHFLSQRRGVRQKNLNLGMIKAFKIPITKREQQDEFSDFVKQVDKSKVTKQIDSHIS